MKKKIFFSLAVFLLVFSVTSIVKASGNVFGWLWGGNSGVITTTTNLGWISMNSANCDADNDGVSDGVGNCPAAGTAISDYGVTIPAAGNATGKAWSENLGWVDFDPAGDFIAYPVCGFPSSPCNSVQRNGDNLEGWARIMSIPQAGANAGGWEGWIKMHSVIGDPTTYGATIENDGTFCKAGDPATDGAGRCFAWSDELGWIDFSRATVGPSPAVKTLKICRNNCGSGTVRDGTAFSMTVASTENLVACYTSTACLDPAPGLANNVTNAATTAWNETNLPQNAISLSLPGTDPRVVTANIAGNSEQVKVSYDPGTGNIDVDFTVNVVALGPICGNGMLEGAEVCDDGPANGDCAAGASCSDGTGGIPACTSCPSSTGPDWREVAP